MLKSAAPHGERQVEYHLGTVRVLQGSTDWAQFILVNTVRAGFIDTPLHQKLGRTNIEKRIQAIPLKRAGKAEDIARMVLFLASESGDFITGEIFTVSGGD